MIFGGSLSSRLSPPSRNSGVFGAARVYTGDAPGPKWKSCLTALAGSNTTAHVHDWIRACKGGTAACSNFSVAAPFTEWLVLGAAAVHVEGKLLGDNKKGKFTNNKEANRWVKAEYH